MLLKFYYHFKYWLGQNWRKSWLILLPVLFFLATASYNYYGQQGGFVKWTSPDETANYQMAKQYALQDKLLFRERNNLLVDGIIQPRSLRSDGSLLKPVSFLGIMIYYGTLAKYLSIDFLPYMTPLFAAIGLIYYYLLMAKLFDKTVAGISTVLLSVFPVYIYFSVHSFFHNVLFVVALVIALYYLVLASERPFFSKEGDSKRECYCKVLTLLWSVLAGLAFGVAIAARTSELIWLAPMMLLLWLFNVKRFSPIKIFFFLYGALAAYSPILFWNSILYGSPFSSGYPHMDKSVHTIVTSSAAIVQTAVIPTEYGFFSKYFGSLYKAVFTFGINPNHSFKMAYYYLYWMFGWLITLSSLGFILYVLEFGKRRWKDLVYVLCCGLSAGILIFYYGSWIFYDNPDPNSYTIGNSYTRYWLPIYLSVLPFAAVAINRFAKLFIKKSLIIWIRVAILAIIATNCILFVLYGSDEGLVHQYYRQVASRQEYDKVLQYVPQEGIIVTRYHDKLFFPERAVIVGLLTDPNMNLRYGILAKKVPVYYYNFRLKQADLDYLNRGKLKEVGLRIEKIADITEKFTLYQLSSIEPTTANAQTKKISNIKEKVK